MGKRYARRLLPLKLLLLASLAGGCATDAGPGTVLPESLQAGQLVVVTTPGWDSPGGQLRRFERSGAGWRLVERGQPVTIGRAGSAWGLGLHAAQVDGPLKREGDGRSPAGVFRIGTAFGYAATADTQLPYQAMLASHYCVDVSGSPLYNQIVDARSTGADAVAGSTEPMRRDLHAEGDQRYRLGFVIEHNPTGQAMGGSCIFAHLWRSPTEPTSGCTAMDAAVMERLLAWLRPESRPLFVLLPESEYQRLRIEWNLPELGGSP